MWRSPLSYALMILKLSMKYKCYFEAQVWIFSCVFFWDILFVSSLGSFPHFKGNTLYITRMNKINTLLQGTDTKTETISWCMQMYASASVAGYAMILARHVAIL